MEDADPFAMKQLIKNALDECNDLDLLDLIFKLLVTNSIQ